MLNEKQSQKRIKELEEDIGNDEVAVLKRPSRHSNKLGMYPLTTNIELIQIADILEFQVEVLSKNLLNSENRTGKKEGNYIINLQDSDKGNGTHWVGLVVYPKEAYYYDSFGISPPKEVLEFIDVKSNDKKHGGKYKNGKRELYVSTKQIQNIYGGYCGQYVSDFLNYMNNENQNKNRLNRFKQYLNLWKDRR